MTKIENLTASPYDIVTLSGPRVLPALGSLTAEFEPSYLHLLVSGGAVVVVDDDAAEHPQQGEGGDSESEDTDHTEEQGYDGAGADDEQQEAELSAAEQYQLITGKKPDGRWSEERLIAELESLGE